MDPNNVDKAEFSPCGQYRYCLTRKISENPQVVKPALFIMLNPSTADEINNDPTVRRCISFAKREGCSSLTVVNIYALRATDPKELKNHPDPSGPENKKTVARLIKENRANNGIIVVAWGANPMVEIGDLLHKYGPYMCLGTNKNGSPKHPLYVKTDQKLERMICYKCGYDESSSEKEAI